MPAREVPLHLLVVLADNAQVVFKDNGAESIGGAIESGQDVTVAGSVQFTNNSAKQGGAIDSHVNVIIADNAQVVFQSNYAEIGGAVFSGDLDTIAGLGQYITLNNYSHGGVIITQPGSVAIANNAKAVFRDNHADIAGGAICSGQYVTITIAGSVQFINGGAVSSYHNVTTADNAHVVFQGNHADSVGGAIILINSNVLLVSGSVQFISNTAQLGGAISMFPGQMTVANDTQVVFKGNNAYHVGGAIYLL